VAEKTYLNREDVLRILKINDEELDALVREGKLQEKEEGRFDEEDVIVYATEYPTDLEEEEIKILPSIEEPVVEEKEKGIKILALSEEVALSEEARKGGVPPLIEEPMPVVNEGLPISPIEPEEEVKAEPEAIPKVSEKVSEVEEPVLSGVPELAAPSPRESLFFTLLSLLSLVMMLVSVGILILPILNVAIPEFIK
jgi:hypothetical protein